MSLIDIVNGESPFIAFSPEQLEILESPNAFFDAINKSIKSSKHRIVLSSLYIGTGEHEQELIRSIEENANRPRVQIFVEATRTTRQTAATDRFAGHLQQNGTSTNGKGFSSCLQLLIRLVKFQEASVALYHSHLLRGWLRRLLPERINETVGLQHMKVYVFDDTVILSGANLSGEYFTTRTDRAWVFRGVRELADFYTGLISAAASMSYQLQPDGSIQPASPQFDPVLSDERNYRELFGAKIEDFLNTFHKRTQNRLNFASSSNSFVLPLVQMGAYGVHQDSNLLSRILALIPTLSVPPTEVALTTGYFCPTEELEMSLVGLALNKQTKVRVLCASPQANSFFKSKGLSGGIPKAYREMLIGFLQRVSSTFTDPANHMSVAEYERPGWTFHAKGLWIDGGDDSSISWIGSSNWGARSRDRDLETQILVYTNNPQLGQRIRQERKLLWDPKYIRPIDLETVSRQTELRFKWWARWTLPWLRRIM